jgi:hypothetical protein
MATRKQSIENPALSANCLAIPRSPADRRQSGGPRAPRTGVPEATAPRPAPPVRHPGSPRRGPGTRAGRGTPCS